MDVLAERFTNPAVAIPIVVLVLYFVYNRFAAGEAVPAGLPWVGKDPSKFFAETRAALQSFNCVRDWLNEGYEKARPLDMITSPEFSSADTTISTPNSTNPTSSLISRVILRSSSPAPNLSGYLSSPTTSSVHPLTMRILSKGLTPSPILTFLKIHITSMLYTSFCREGLGHRYPGCGKS